ncbi:CPBP family glutamic-type intramembrane protease [Oleiharenicola lentus]|uniref:CPBP family glutamic-type intramembrane protease n=1 Tax=Oleiharenicola lentus TaxID=2508720 RepID=UPI003F66E248
MGQDNPLLLLVMLGAAGYAGKIWLDDYRDAKQGKPNPRALPGATSAPRLAILIAAAGGLALLIGETLGEYALGVSDEQSSITVLFGLYTLAAAFVEELIFRGYLVIDKRGRSKLMMSVVGASLVFAILHPFLWSWDMGATSAWQALQVWRWDEWFTWQFTTKAWFSTGVVFAGSLWFYFVRFMPGNSQDSLLPCFAAHAAKNLGVFAVKYAQGFVSGWW